MTPAPRRGHTLALATAASVGLSALGSVAAAGTAFGLSAGVSPAGVAPAVIGAPVASGLPAALTAGNPSTIPSGATGTLRLHRLRPASGSGDVPVAGVVLKVTRVTGVDLRTSAGWEQAADYQRNPGRIAGALGESRTTAPTDSNGRTVVSDLPVGLYLVQEVSGGSSISGYVPSDDILVTVPTSDPATATWRYTVDAYPKTSGTTITKSVADGNAGYVGQDAPVAGRALTYTLTAGIPRRGLASFGGTCLRANSTDTSQGLDRHGFTSDGMCAPGATYSGIASGAAYEIIDDLTEGSVRGSAAGRSTNDFLEFRAGDWDGSVSVALTGRSPRTLAQCVSGASSDCDYTLSLEPHRIAVAMTDRGLATLASARASDDTAKVRVDAQARVRPGRDGSPAPVETATRHSSDELAGAVPAFVLTLPNTAVLFPNGTSKRTGTPVESNTVVTKYSTLTLHKISKHDGDSLAGAEFTLYRTRGDAEARANALAVSAPTDKAGMTQFAGLHVTDYQNDTFTDDSYWIVETRTPVGYRSAGHPIEVKLLMDGTTVGADHTLGKPIVNERGDTPGGVTPDGPSPSPSEPSSTPTGGGTTPGGSTPPGGSNRPTWMPPLPELPYTGMEVGTAAALAAALVAAGVLLRRAGREKEQGEPEA